MKISIISIFYYSPSKRKLQFGGGSVNDEFGTNGFKGTESLGSMGWTGNGISFASFGRNL